MTNPPYFLPIGIIVFLFLFGCSENIQNQANLNFQKNCGADVDCFGEQLALCQPAFMEKETFILFNALIKYEIIKLTPEGCKIHYTASNPSTKNKFEEKSFYIKCYEEGRNLIDTYGYTFKECPKIQNENNVLKIERAKIEFVPLLQNSSNFNDLIFGVRITPEYDANFTKIVLKLNNLGNVLTEQTFDENTSGVREYAIGYDITDKVPPSFISLEFMVEVYGSRMQLIQREQQSYSQRQIQHP